MRMQDRAYVRMQKAVCAARLLRAHSKSFLGLIFPKIDLFAHLKVIFFILTFLKSI